MIENTNNDTQTHVENNAKASKNNNIDYAEHVKRRPRREKFLDIIVEILESECIGAMSLRGIARKLRCRRTNSAPSFWALGGAGSRDPEESSSE